MRQCLQNDYAGVFGGYQKEKHDGRPAVGVEAGA